MVKISENLRKYGLRIENQYYEIRMIKIFKNIKISSNI